MPRVIVIGSLAAISAASAAVVGLGRPPTLAQLFYLLLSALSAAGVAVLSITGSRHPRKKILGWLLPGVLCLEDLSYRDCFRILVSGETQLGEPCSAVAVRAQPSFLSYGLFG